MWRSVIAACLLRIARQTDYGRAVGKLYSRANAMAASAERIDFIGHDARNVADLGGQRSTLTVDFRVFRRGPAHVAGLSFTTDFWITPRESLARFLRFDGDFEVWQAIVTVPGNNATFEYVIFCRDHRDVQNVRQIFHTNFGNTFHIAATHF